MQRVSVCGESTRVLPATATNATTTITEVN